MKDLREYKKYVYVSNKKRPEIEELCNERSIYLQLSFINTYDFNKLFLEGLKNLNGVDFLFLDLAAIVNTTKNNQDITVNLTLMRKMYRNLRIIIIAEGYKTGDSILGRIFNLGIYNIVTASNDIELRKEIEETLSEEGMTFGRAMQYKVDSNISIGNSTAKVEKEFIRAKQTVSIGVCATERHLGATSLALNIASFINEYPNERACYIENNNHDTISSLTNLKEALFFEKQRKIEYKGMDLFLKPNSIADIQKYDFSIYVYDFGNFNEMTNEERNSFLTRDLKFVVTGSRRWEYGGIADCLYHVRHEENTYIYVNHTNLEEREEFKNSFDEFWRSRIYFSLSNSNSFEVNEENRQYFKNILEPYLLNTVIEEKKKGLKGLFSKKGRNR